MAHKYNQVRLKLVGSYTNLKTAMTGFRLFPDPKMLTPTHPNKKKIVCSLFRTTVNHNIAYTHKSKLLHCSMYSLSCPWKQKGTQHLGTQECEGELFFTRESESIAGTLQTFICSFTNRGFFIF